MEATRSYLFVTWSGGGNVAPVLSVARRLADRGHRITVLAEPCMQDAIEKVGARFVAFTKHFTRADATVDIVGDWEASTPVAALRRALKNLMFGPARSVAEETREAIRAHSPDVLVVDLNMPGALLAGEAAGLPTAVLFHMPEYLPGPGRPAAGPGFTPREDLFGHLRDGLFAHLLYKQIGRHRESFNDARRALGLAPLASAKDILDLYHRADLRLILTSEAFDFPIKPAPTNVRYVGPVLDEPEWVEDDWKNPWPANDDRPLVVVSLSTTYQKQRDALQRAITALGELDVRGLVTLGPVMESEEFDLPANVVAVPSAPHGRIFPEADAVVTHAGHGTVMRALAHGLPLVCMPMGRDQNDNAAKVAFHGVGIRLSPSAKPGKISAAVRRVLEDSSYRTRARHLQEILLEDAASELAVQELEAVGLSRTRDVVAA